MQNAEALLGVALPASADEIRRAYLRQIARYHPDKVHHLGEEFRVLAAEKSAQLTDAYHSLLQTAGSDPQHASQDRHAVAVDEAARHRDDDVPDWRVVPASCPSLIIRTAADRLVRAIASGIPRLEELSVADFFFAAHIRPSLRERLNRQPSSGLLVRLDEEGGDGNRRPARVRRLIPAAEGPIVVFEIVVRKGSAPKEGKPADSRRGPTEPNVFVVTIDAMNWNAEVPRGVPEFVHRLLSGVRHR